MGSKNQETRNGQAWALARRQHGVVTRRQLLELGFSEKSIRHRLGNGRLHSLAPGAYSVTQPGLITQEARWMAAVLVCGADAALSHRSAAALWGIARQLPGRIDVSIRRHSDLRRSGIRVRCRKTLSPHDIGCHQGIPLTQPVQTLIDIATEVTPRELERAVNEADKRDRVDPETLRSALDDHAGEPGVIALRDLLDRHTFRLSDDELELLFRPLAAAAGLPTPLTKYDSTATRSTSTGPTSAWS